MDDKQRIKAKISLKALINDILPDFNHLDKENISLYLALFIGVITIIYVILRVVQRGHKKNVVAILGLCEAGKTLLFSRLCYQKDALSVTSIKESSANYLLKNKTSVLCYDVPGHDRIRYGLFDKVKQQLKGLIFVIDAASIQRDLRDVAEFLYTLFCDGYVQKERPCVLIVCNKQDLPTAKGKNLIKASLEKEINLLRTTKANQLESVGEGKNNNNFLGYVGEEFEFEHLRPLKVSFVEAITKEGEQLEDVENWINSL